MPLTFSEKFFPQMFSVQQTISCVKQRNNENTRLLLLLLFLAFLLLQGVTHVVDSVVVTYDVFFVHVAVVTSLLLSLLALLLLV